MENILSLLDLPDAKEGHQLLISSNYDLEVFKHMFKMKITNPENLTDDDIQFGYVMLARALTRAKHKVLSVKYIVTFLDWYLKDWTEEQQGMQLKQIKHE